jgi:hypothetical protein
MPLLPGQIVRATPGVQGFDTSTHISAAAAAAFRQSGFGFCVRYLSRTSPQAASDLSHAEAQAILAGGLGLMVVQHVMRAGWVPDTARGAQYGTVAAVNAHAVGLPPGMTIWLDLEGVRGGVDSADVIAYCNAWFDPVAAAGYVPGLYVGANCGLDGDALYWRLQTRHYWRSASDVPELPHRGYQLVQRVNTAPDVVNGIAIDRDVAYADAFGDTVSWLACPVEST